MVCPPNAGMSYLTVWLSFDDMRDASNAMEDVGRLCPASRLSYISHNEFVFGSRANGPRGIQSETSFYDGQLVLKATFFEHGKEFSARGLYEEVVALCKRIGEIVGVAERIVDANIRHYHVEFYKISDAKYMVAQSDDQAPTDINVSCLRVQLTSQTDADCLQGWLITVTEIPDVHPENTPQRLATLGTPQKLLYENGNTAQVSSPTGRTNWTFNQYGMPIPTPAIKQLPKITSITAGISMTPAGRRIRGSDPVPVTPASCVPDVAYMQRSGSWPSTDKPPKTVPYTRRRMPEFHPNVINVERIEQGIDVRTTIMVRNIPNEMTADQLKEVVDRACRGRYDFIYLRFDFAQNKNVGYAFVNFLAPSDVLTFFYAYNGKEYIEGMGYHPVRGPRLGEIAYATCQGQDCAIEKFRNSSIMCEYPGYRPRLFWTIEDAPMESLVSQERQFPGINNHSKHNRSKDNAAQIGLYAPKSRNGAVITRNSQFDRGTPAQMQEDAMFQHHQMYQQPFAQQQMVQQPFGYGYNDGSYALGNQHMSMPMGMGMPVGSYPVMYNAGQQYVPYQTAMNGSPHAYAPSAPAFHGSPGPIMPPTFTGSPGPMHHNGFNPSRLRTITGGRLGNPVRRRMTVRPPRDLETAIREVEEGRREQEEYDAMKAIMEVEEEAAATQSAGTPRFMNGEENNGGTQGQYGSVNGHAMGRFDSRQGNGEKHH